MIVSDTTTEIQLTMEELMETKEVSTKTLDTEIAELSKLRETYQGMKSEASAAHLRLKEQETKVLNLLDIADKKSYKVDGLGTVSKIEKLAVTTPKTTDAKRDFFSWIRETMGEDAVWAYASVNSNTLNSLYNTQTEEYAERGETLDIKGIDMPTTRTTLSFRSTNS